jgi:hypothetical protein
MSMKAVQTEGKNILSEETQENIGHVNIPSKTKVMRSMIAGTMVRVFVL